MLKFSRVAEYAACCLMPSIFSLPVCVFGSGTNYKQYQLTLGFEPTLLLVS